jgi:hypothetical protein
VRSTAAKSAPRARSDAVAVGAVEAARDALIADVGPDGVGEHLGHVVEGDRLVTHLFAATMPGYRGWRWSVTVARAARARQVTVDEVVLLPGDDAIVAPAWVPYRERIQPGDLSPGDVLPVPEDDPRLVPTYSFGDDDLDDDARDQIRSVSKDLGLGRVRTLSPEGRAVAAERWYHGDAGPSAALAQSAPGRCHGCGFLVRLSGSLSTTFGVCANGDANDDGRVVSLDHGCGAHSEATLTKRHRTPSLPDHVHDTLDDDLVWI